MCVSVDFWLELACILWLLIKSCDIDFGMLKYLKTVYYRIVF